MDFREAGTLQLPRMKLGPHEQPQWTFSYSTLNPSVSTEEFTRYGECLGIDSSNLHLRLLRFWQHADKAQLDRLKPSANSSSVAGPSSDNDASGHTD